MTNNKDNILHRLKIIKGHISGVEKMVENDAYCIDVVHQSLAIQKALKKLDALIMKDHIKHCVVDQIKKGDTQKITEELLKIYEYK